ncbi:hypothetical protein SADUNF_Sadunf06G0147500 [Salix dunnii]|uniref:START domain-containing protein n=1 Tax=Salix dunnii TaxID=1413687 RepID=A0A835JZ92_9ROSI|nr:hypothetical protein SADUNF_Sadunf06G0147500 [Salix dunnii]
METTTLATEVKVERDDGSDGGSGSGSSSGGGDGGGEERGVYMYSGWVYHLGTNSIGHQYCHLRFMFIKGKYVEMYKRDPQEHPGIDYNGLMESSSKRIGSVTVNGMRIKGTHDWTKPIRKGVIGPTLMVEELERRKVNHGDFYIVRFYNQLDETKKGEIACPTAGEAQKWMEAFNHGKQQAKFELSRGGSTRNKLNMEMEYASNMCIVLFNYLSLVESVYHWIINLEGHRPRMRRYAHGLKRLIRIGQGSLYGIDSAGLPGPETLLRQSSNLASNVRPDGYFDGEVGDAFEFHQWQCVRTVNGVRIFEDVTNSKSGKGVLVKAVTVIEASADTVFDVVLNLDRHQRYEWDVLTGDLELLDSYDGHYDIVYGTCDSTCLSR